jgi:hypothetical protein
MTLAKLKAENKRVKNMARELVVKEDQVLSCLHVGESLYKLLNKALTKPNGMTNMGLIDKNTSFELEENFAVLKHIRNHRSEIDANLKEMMESVE